MEPPPGQLKEAIWLRPDRELAHGLHIESVPCLQVAFGLRRTNLHTLPDRLVDCSPDRGIQAHQVGLLRQCQQVRLVGGNPNHTIHHTIKWTGHDSKTQLDPWLGASLLHRSLQENGSRLVIVSKSARIHRGKAATGTPSSSIEQW